MRLTLPSQSLIVPLAVMIFVLGFYPMWNHRNVSETSPVFASQAALEQWENREIRVQHCIRASVDFTPFAETALPDTPWAGQFRCNQPSIYGRLALLAFGPWLVMNLIGLLLTGKPRALDLDAL